MPWSAWQDGYDNTAQISAAENYSNSEFFEVEDFTGADVAEADLDAAVAAILANGGTWGDAITGAARAAISAAVDPGLLSQTICLYDYEGVTLLGSAAESQLPQELPADLPDTAGEIPDEFDDDHCLDGLVQFESIANTFLAWQDTTLPVGTFNTDTDDGGNTAGPHYPAGTGPYSFTPPADAPWMLGVVDPVTAVGPQSGFTPDSVPRYPGPHLFPSDLDPLATFTVDIRSTDRPGAPYTLDFTGGSFELLRPGGTFDVPMSGVTRKDLSLFLMSGYFNGVPLPVTGGFGSNDARMVLDAIALSVSSSGGTLLSWFYRLTFPAAMHSPRWRYWITDAVYTVGGHWATPSGVQVMSLKGDGVTWIPVVDGLAPPLA